MTRRRAARTLLAAALVAVATGCSATDGTPTAESAAGSSEATTTSSSPPSSSSPPATTTSRSAVAPTPTGEPIGVATMMISGTGTATISYQINGAAEQVEENVTLPWQREYPVYNEVQSSVTADAGDAELTCSIVMDGQLAAFTTEPRPTCSFAYY